MHKSKRIQKNASYMAKIESVNEEERKGNEHPILTTTSSSEGIAASMLPVCWLNANIAS